MADTRERIAAFLNEKWQGRKNCPICQNNKWEISDKPAELREYSQGGLVVGGPVYPLVVLTCRVCGHTLLFNAIVMDVVEKEKSEPSKSEVSSDQASGVAKGATKP